MHACHITIILPPCTFATMHLLQARDIAAYAAEQRQLREERAVMKEAARAMEARTVKLEVRRAGGALAARGWD
jgi:hypothetical protein